MKKILYKLLFVFTSVFVIVFFDELGSVIAQLFNANNSVGIMIQLLWFFGVPALLLIWLVKMSFKRR